MPPLIDEQIRRNVIRQWISGIPRDRIAEENNIGTGTVSSIVANYKAELEELDFASIRQLALEIRKQGLNWSHLASRIRLYNFFRESEIPEEEIEAFIDKVHHSGIPKEKVIQYVNQLYDILEDQSTPLNEVPTYIKQRLEEKQKIDQEIKDANDILHNKTVTIEVINEHIQLKEELDKHGISIQDIDKLLNLLSNAKENGFDPRLIVRKLRNIKRLENKENKLKASCEVLSKKEAKYKEIIPLANLIWDLHIGGSELISFEIAVNEAAEMYGFPRSTAASHVLNNLRDYNRVGALKKELSGLYLQKFAVNEFCSRHSQAIMALANLQSHGITQEQIISLNNFLESNGYKTSSYTVQPHAAPNSQFQGKR